MFSLESLWFERFWLGWFLPKNQTRSFWVNKNLGLKIFGHKKFRSEKILVQMKILGTKIIFGSKKLFESKKILGLKKVFWAKLFWVQKYLWFPKSF